MPAFRTPTAMDDKTLNLWRQIEGARRTGKRQARSSASVRINGWDAAKTAYRTVF